MTNRCQGRLEHQCARPLSGSGFLGLQLEVPGGRVTSQQPRPASWAYERYSVVQNQPRPQSVWMSTPKPLAEDCPPGLEYLTDLENMQVQQVVSVYEMMSGDVPEKNYKVFNSLGEQFYAATEESGGCHRNCCAETRKFTMHVIDKNKMEVLRLSRPYKWCQFCTGCQDEISIEAPAGKPLGYVYSQCCHIRPTFRIFDSSQGPIFDVKGTYMNNCNRYAMERELDIFNYDKTDTHQRSLPIGRISRLSIHQNVNNFSIFVPQYMRVRYKALVLASVFLLDFLAFDDHPNLKRRG